MFEMIPTEVQKVRTTIGTITTISCSCCDQGCNYSKFNDTRPPLNAGKPEERRYRLRYFIDNKEVGNWSDVIVVITLP